MTYKDRQYYEELSLAAFGTKHQYLKEMKKPQMSRPFQFGTVSGRELYGYPSLEQVEQVMLIMIKSIKESEAQSVGQG